MNAPPPSGPRALGAAARRVAARGYHAVRRAWYRVLHPRRHARVKAMLAGRSRPRSVLVMCMGNICRSPYLEAALRARLANVDISSAGFVGPGRTVPPHGMSIAAARGLDLSSHRSRLVTSEMLGKADLVIVMDERQARRLVRGFNVPAGRVIVAGDLDPQIGEARTIRDPWQQDLSVFEASYDRLERCAIVLAESIPSSA